MTNRPFSPTMCHFLTTAGHLVLTVYLQTRSNTVSSLVLSLLSLPGASWGTVSNFNYIWTTCWRIIFKIHVHTSLSILISSLHPVSGPWGPSVAGPPSCVLVCVAPISSWKGPHNQPRMAGTRSLQLMSGWETDRYGWLIYLHLQITLKGPALPGLITALFVLLVCRRVQGCCPCFVDMKASPCVFGKKS